MLKFIGVDQYEKFDSQQQWSIHERSENIKNMDNESISKLSNDDIHEINKVASDCMTHFGYPLIEI